MSNGITITIPRTAMVLAGVLGLAVLALVIFPSFLDRQLSPDEDSEPDIGVLKGKGVVFVVAIEDADADAGGKIRLLGLNGDELTPCKPIGGGKFENCDFEDIDVKRVAPLTIVLHTGSAHPCATIYPGGLPIQVHAGNDPNHNPDHWKTGQASCHQVHNTASHYYP